MRSRRGRRSASRWALDFTVGFFGGARRTARRRSSSGWGSSRCSTRRIGALSKGQRKRALLAIGLLTPQPRAAADEPFDGLDLRQTREVGAPCATHAAARPHVFLSIHQISDAARVCDRFVLLSGGRVCGEGTLDELGGAGGGARRRGRPPISKRCSLRSRRAPWLLARLRKEWRELIASRAWWVMLVADRAAGRRVVHQRGAHLRRSERAERHRGRRRRSVLAADRRLGADLQRLRAGRGVPAAVRRHPAGRRRPAERRAQDRAAAAGCRRSRASRPRRWSCSPAGSIASLAPVLAVVLWESYGGTHLRAGARRGAAGPHAERRADDRRSRPRPPSVTEHPSTAAILTLSVTVGTWIVNFIAAVQGGVWERAAGYTPTAMVAEFQHGLMRLDVVLIALALIVGGAGARRRSGRGSACAVRRRVQRVGRRSARVAGGGRPRVHASSAPAGTCRRTAATRFPRRTSGAARRSARRCAIEAHLAPEDPRRFDLEHRALSKLRRVLPRCRSRYVSATSIGLFEQTAPHYGEIWYELGGRAGDEPRDDGRGRARNDLRAGRRRAAGRGRTTRCSAGIRSPCRRGARRRCSTASGRRWCVAGAFIVQEEVADEAGGVARARRRRARCGVARAAAGGGHQGRS